MTVFGSARLIEDNTALEIAYNTGHLARIEILSPSLQPGVTLSIALEEFCRNAATTLYPWALFDRHMIAVPSSINPTLPTAYMTRALVKSNGRVVYHFQIQGRLGGCQIDDLWTFEMNANPRRHLTTLRANLNEWLDEKYGRRSVEVAVMLPTPSQEMPTDDIDGEDFDDRTCLAAMAVVPDFARTMSEEVARRKALRELRSRQPEKRTFVKTIQPKDPGWENEVMGTWKPMPMPNMDAYFDSTLSNSQTTTFNEGMMVEGRNAEPTVTAFRIKDVAVPTTAFRISDIKVKDIKVVVASEQPVATPTIPRGYTKEQALAPAEAPAVVRDPDYLRINAWMLDMTALLGLTVEEVKEAFDIYPDLVEGTVVLRSKAGHVVARGTLPLGKEVPAPELLELYAAPETPGRLPAAPVLTVREVPPAAAPAEDVDPDARAPLELY